MDDDATRWQPKLMARARGARGLIVGLVIGAVAFGASTAGAGTSKELTNPGGPSRGIEEECAEGCDHEEINEYVWGEGLTEYIIEQVLEAPPTTSPRLAAKP